MPKTVSPDAISFILANPSPDSSTDLPEIIVQVLNLSPYYNNAIFKASDGKKKMWAILQSDLFSEVVSGKIQNLGLIRVLDYTLEEFRTFTKNQKFMFILKGEVVSPALEEEYKAQPETEGSATVSVSEDQLNEKRGTTEGGSSYIDERWEAKLTIQRERNAQLERLIAIGENAVRINEGRKQIEKERLEIEIMAQDTSGMDEIHAAYWNKKKTEILKKNGLI